MDNYEEIFKEPIKINAMGVPDWVFSDLRILKTYHRLWLDNIKFIREIHKTKEYRNRNLKQNAQGIKAIIMGLKIWEDFTQTPGDLVQ